MPKKGPGSAGGLSTPAVCVITLYYPNWVRTQRELSPDRLLNGFGAYRRRLLENAVHEACELVGHVLGRPPHRPVVHARVEVHRIVTHFDRDTVLVVSSRSARLSRSAEFAA